jgi:VanZ family protein
MGDVIRRWVGKLIRRRVLWTVWVVGMLVWTYLLLVPADWLPPWFRFGHEKGTGGIGWGKVGHASAYALLTAYPFWLPLSRPQRVWAFVVVLSVHAFGTEYLQTWVPTRSGSWTDVGIDHAGVAAGLLLGGLSNWGRRRFGALGFHPDRELPTPKANGRAGRENAQADPLRNG